MGHSKDTGQAGSASKAGCVACRMSGKASARYETSATGTAPQSDHEVLPSAVDKSPAPQNLSSPMSLGLRPLLPQSERLAASQEPAATTSQQDPVPSREQHGNDSVWQRTDLPSPDTSLAKDLYKKLGVLVIGIFLVGLKVILAIMGVWTFLWFGNNSNPAWHWIMAHDHLKVIVSFSAEIANRLAGLMLGAEWSMIVALALEQSDVLFPDIATISLARAGSGQRLSMMRKMIHIDRPLRGFNMILAAVALSVVLLQTLSFATHTLLLADISVARIPAGKSAEQMTVGFKYYPQTISNQAGDPNILYRSSAWGWKAPFYPAFAEYSENPFEKEGVSDTGVTLRAFLPLADPSVRQAIHSYSGPTTVLDARVTCQIPVFEGLSLEGQGNNLLLSGFVRASQWTPRLGNVTLLPAPKDTTYTTWLHNSSVPFICIAPLANTSTWGVPDQWRTVICQLTETGQSGDGISGGIVSEFRDYSSWLAASSTFNSSWDYGTAYLVFNVTAGSSFLWGDFFGSQAVLPMLVPDGKKANEWLEFIIAEDLSFGATLCYSAFDTADLPIEIASELSRNVTEPSPNFNFGTKRYEFEGLRRQYGQMKVHSDPDKALSDRGILTLEKQSWIAGPNVQPPTEPYLRTYANLAGIASEGDGNDPNWSGSLWDAQIPESLNLSDHYQRLFSFPSVNFLKPDPMHAWLFQDIVAHGGSVAFALQCLITLLTSMAYYDQLPQFDKVAQVQQSLFKETNLPTSYWGWSVVTSLLTFHLVLSFAVLAWFVCRTKYTFLGQKWQALAQATTSETAPYLEKAVDMSDKEVQEYIEGQGGTDLLKARVRLGPLGKDGKIGVYVVH